jgi:hypothetical protein
VRISDCHVEAGDDGIVIKNRPEFAEYGPTENITVTGCTVKSTSSALKVGTETIDDFRNIVFSSCVVHGSNRGLAIQLRDRGNVENVLFSSIVVNTRLFADDWWGKAEPIYVTAVPRDEQTTVGAIRNVRFTNIMCRAENGVLVWGEGPGRIDDIHFDSIDIDIVKQSKWPGGVYDVRPCSGEGVFRAPTAGMRLKGASRISIRNANLRCGVAEGIDPGAAIEAHEVDDLETTGITARGFRDDPNGGKERA